jgi:Mg2+-importing ATPase
MVVAMLPPIEASAALTTDEVLDALGTRASGLNAAEVSERTARFGPNAVRSHHVGAWSVLGRQLRSPLLWLLLAAATVSGVVGEGLDAIIIGLIVAASVGLGFVNEFRAERAAQALHSEIRHEVATMRDGQPVGVEVTHLVPGDIVHLGVGSIVPADLRLMTATHLECDESILTGESVPSAKSPEPVASGAPIAELSSCLFMGTVVHEGTADAVVVATGPVTQFGSVKTTRKPSSSSVSLASRACSPRSA